MSDKVVRFSRPADAAPVPGAPASDFDRLADMVLRLLEEQQALRRQMLEMSGHHLRILERLERLEQRARR